MEDFKDLKKKIKALKKEFYQKGSEHKYQLKLKSLIKESKDLDKSSKIKALVKQTKKIEKKLSKHFSIHKKKDKKSKKDKKDKGDKEEESTAGTPPSEKKEKVEEVVKTYPAPEGELNARGQKLGSVTLLLFYAYVNPVWSNAEQDQAINFTYDSLQRHGCTGRLRVAREGFNGVQTGSYEGIRAFTSDLKKYQPHNFEKTDFKYVDKQPDNHMLRELKVWPVSELVTYGFNAAQGRLENGGKHLSPEAYHKAMELPNTIMIDVRNFNETVIGKFKHPNLLDPCMRKSTEFPNWVDQNMEKLKGKKILMYCTGGIRCERASAYLTQKGLDDINQLDGGIHRYLEAYPEDGGHWIGKNYTFDKRFSHGAEKSDVVGKCVVCDAPWERYQANKKCTYCKMEILVCKPCIMNIKTVPIAKTQLVCPLCR